MHQCNLGGRAEKYTDCVEPCDRCAGIFFALQFNHKRLYLKLFFAGPTTATGGGWVYRDYYFTFPDQTYFWEIHFADWYFAGTFSYFEFSCPELIESSGLLNYWGVQVPFVSFFEAGDPTCGDRVCGGNDFLGRPETCATCPTDCGACPMGVCGNGRCEFGESWAPRVR